MSSLVLRKHQPCQKYRPNVFDKSKCSNCFQSREDHLNQDHDLKQASILHQGWLLMAPTEPNSNNAVENLKSESNKRRWNRRFFLLYEHGMLQYKIEDSELCTAQGGTDLNRICGIDDGYIETGHKNSIKISINNGNNVGEKNSNYNNNESSAEISSLYIKTDDRDEFHAWKEVLVDFLKERQEQLRQKRRREKLKMRSQTQEVIPTYENDLSKTLPKNFKNPRKSENLTLRETRGNNNKNKMNETSPFQRCKSNEVTGGHPDNLRDVSLNFERLQPIDQSITNDNFSENLVDRGRSFGKAERRAKAFRENRRNSELAENSLNSISLVQKDETSSLRHSKSFSNRPLNTNNKYNNNSSLSTNPTIINSHSSAYRLNRNSEINSSSSILSNTSNNSSILSNGIRRTKSMDRKSFVEKQRQVSQQNNENDTRFRKFGRLHIKKLSSNNTNESNNFKINFGVLKALTLTFFMDEDKALLSKYQNDYELQIELKNVSSVKESNTPSLPTSSLSYSGSFTSNSNLYEFLISMSNSETKYVLAAQTRSIRSQWIYQINSALDELRESQTTTKSGIPKTTSLPIAAVKPIISKTTKIQAVSPTFQKLQVSDNQEESKIESISNNNNNISDLDAAYNLISNKTPTGIRQRITPKREARQNRRAKTLDIDTYYKDRGISNLNEISSHEIEKNKENIENYSLNSDQSQINVNPFKNGTVYVKPRNTQLNVSNGSLPHIHDEILIDKELVYKDSVRISPVKETAIGKPIIQSQSASFLDRKNPTFNDDKDHQVLQQKCTVYKKTISTAVSRLETLANANNELENLNLMHSPETKIESKLLHMLDSIIASSEIKEKTLINRLEESRNEINKREQQLKTEKQEIESQRKNIAAINEKLKRENLELEDKLRKIELQIQSTDQTSDSLGSLTNLEGLPRGSSKRTDRQNSLESPRTPSAAPIVPLKISHLNEEGEEEASHFNFSNIKHGKISNDIGPISVNTTLNSSTGPESPPDYVKKLKSLDSDFSESTKRFEIRLGQLQNNNSKNNTNSATSSISGSVIDVRGDNDKNQNNVNNVLKVDGVGGPHSPGLADTSSSSVQNGNRRRRNRGMISKVSSSNVSLGEDSTVTSGLELGKALSEKDFIISDLKAKINNLQDQLSLTKPNNNNNNNSNITNTKQHKYYTIAGNKTTTKEIKKLLSNHLNSTLTPELQNSILTYLTKAEEQENYKLVKKENYDQLIKQLDNLQNEASLADQTIEKEKIKLKKSFEEQANKQLVDTIKEKTEDIERKVKEKFDKELKNKEELFKSQKKEIQSKLKSQVEKLERQLAAELTNQKNIRATEQAKTTKSLAKVKILEDQIENYQKEILTLRTSCQELSAKQLDYDQKNKDNEEKNSKLIKKQAFQTIFNVMSQMKAVIFGQFEIELRKALEKQQKQMDSEIELFKQDCKIVKNLLSKDPVEKDVDKFDSGLFLIIHLKITNTLPPLTIEKIDLKPLSIDTIKEVYWTNLIDLQETKDQLAKTKSQLDILQRTNNEDNSQNFHSKLNLFFEEFSSQIKSSDESKDSNNDYDRSLGCMIDLYFFFYHLKVFLKEFQSISSAKSLTKLITFSIDSLNSRSPIPPTSGESISKTAI